MSFFNLILLAFAPGLFWLWFIYKKDSFEPEPRRLVIKMFLLGVGIALPASYFNAYYSYNLFLVTVIAAPIIEEYLKFWVVRHFAFPMADFNEPMDGIVYAAAVALGFASIENVFYLIQSLKGGQFTHTLIARSLLSVPAHAIFTSMSGYAMALTKFYYFPNRDEIILRGLFVAMGLHALFNFLALTGNIFSLLFLGFILIIWRLLNQRIKQAQDQSPFRPR